jgi:pyruvate dehydrogenase E1 component
VDNIESTTNNADRDPTETAEWREALLAVAHVQGAKRAQFILDEVAAAARDPRILGRLI